MINLKNALIFIATTGLVLLLLGSIESQKIVATPVTEWADVHQADCAVVLTGSKGRTQKGVELLQKNKVRKVIISGVYKGSRLNDIFPKLAETNLNPQNIILEKISQSTYGNAIQSLPLVQALNCKDILLVTSHLHMYRAFKTFKENFPENIIIHKFATSSRSDKPKFWLTTVEVAKSLFYSIWAY